MGHRKSGNPPLSYRHARDVVFLELRDTVICAECELISYNNSSRCLACGSSAVMSLSRVLGGPLRGKETARLIGSEALDRPVDDVVSLSYAGVSASAASLPVEVAPPAWALATESTETTAAALRAGVQRACAWTGASASAIVVAEGTRMVCRARAGTSAPELGAEVPEEGVTALCVRTRQVWRCDDTERDPWVNRDACRRMAIRSMVIAPVTVVRRLLGVLEIFSPERNGFDDSRAATVQLVASALAVALTREAGARMQAAARLAPPKNLQL